MWSARVSTDAVPTSTDAARAVWAAQAGSGAAGQQGWRDGGTAEQSLRGRAAGAAGRRLATGVAGAWLSAAAGDAPVARGAVRFGALAAGVAGWGVDGGGRRTWGG